MAEPFTGEIIIFAGEYAPRSWAFCDGQSIPISQHMTLYSVINTIYGGNGNTTYNLPNMKGRAPMHSGFDMAPGLSPRYIGETLGHEKIELHKSQLPCHNHAAYASGSGPATNDFENNSLPTFPGLYSNEYSDLKEMNEEVISPEGGSHPHSNMQPYIVLNFIIALDGVYPTRN